VATPTVVESESIILTGVISSPAERQDHQYKATSWLTTQPLGRDRKLKYRVWLRTLPEHAPAARSRRERFYSDYYWVNCVSDAAHPGFQTLVATTGQALSELKLVEGASVSEVRQGTDTAVLNAVTYDYWIPVRPLPAVVTSVEDARRDVSLRASGWESTGSSDVPAATPSDPRGPVSSVATGFSLAEMQQAPLTEFIGWVDGEPPSGAQRRRLEKTEIRLDYSWRWEADRLSVVLSNNRPQDRNYVVYVVVEETLVSGQVLHTYQRVPVTGQLTFVPQAFFDQESAALSKASRFFRELAERYAISLGPVVRGPGDPEPTWLFGLDRQMFAVDPVLRELELNAFLEPEDFRQFATVAMRHPRAAAVLRQMTDEFKIGRTDVQGS
jgi:hypothetical protein